MRIVSRERVKPCAAGLRQVNPVVLEVHVIFPKRIEAP